MNRLEGKVALITGAAGGQGRIACRLFNQEGARVIATDNNAEAGASLQEELRSDGIEIEFIVADVTDSDSVSKLSEYVRQNVGHLDVLYSNHGVILGSPLLDTTEAEWDRVFDVNLKSVYRLIRAFAPLMADRGASIVNVSSIGGVSVFPNLAAYGAAKAGVAMLSKCAAVDLAHLGIRVNAICPGVIDTPMPRDFISTLPNNPDVEGIMQSFAEGSVMNRLGLPEEIVSLALYMASNESTFMTGSVVNVDGGWSLT